MKTFEIEYIVTGTSAVNIVLVDAVSAEQATDYLNHDEEVLSIIEL